MKAWLFTIGTHCGVFSIAPTELCVGAPSRLTSLPRAIYP